MVFNNTGPLPAALTCGNDHVTFVTSTKYLGLTLDNTGLLSACKLRKNKLTAAHILLQRQYLGLRCAMSLSLMLGLYMACVPPVGSHGCELWGLSKMNAGQKKERQTIATDHMRQVRALAGISKTVPAVIVSRELDVLELHDVRLERQVTFWNNVASLPFHNFFYKVMLDNSTDAEVRKLKNWIWSFHKALTSCGYTVLHSACYLPKVDRLCVQKLAQDKISQPYLGLSDDPRSCPSSGAMACTYFSWFSKPDWPVKSVLTTPAHYSLV